MRVKLWHFLALPAIGMAIVLLLASLAESLAARMGPEWLSALQASRGVVITLLMASLIGLLATNYRRQFERQLQARNQELERTRDFLASIIEGSGEGIVTLDPDNHVISWNRAAEHIFGWSEAEMRGETFGRLLPEEPEIVDERKRVEELVRSGETVRDYQTRRLHKDGSEIVVRITWAPLRDRDGRYSGTVAIVLDISAESVMKRRMIERERLAAVGEMAAQVAHEIRNPLAGIKGACEMLFRNTMGEAARREIGGEVVEQIDRLDRTVRDLLQFSRPRPLEPVSTDLNGLIDRVLGALTDDPRSTSLRIERRLDPGLPEVRLDPETIEQVLYNLLLNAAQMMEFSGMISVGTERVDGHVEIRVRDDGPGIAPGMSERIFEPFVTTRVRGTGLGLAIVRRIVEAHEGTVEGASAGERGAEFLVRLPLRRTGAATHA